MSNKYELPLLAVSKPTQHWVIKALWMAGGVLGVQMILVGAFVWKRQSAVPTPPAASVAVAPAAVPAAAPKAAGEAVVLANTAPVAVAPAAESEESRAPRAHHRSSSRSRSHKRMLAHSSSRNSAATVTRPSSSKSDPIDDLLKRFK